MSSINLGPLENPLIRTARESSRFRFSEFAERISSLFLLLLASPILAVCAFVLIALSRRSPLVAHLRVGKNGIPFWMLKLRTMWNADEPSFRTAGWIERIVAEPDTDEKDPCDARVTSRFAAFCRRHSIDELPQLWHVARGEMSLVGPRPLTRSEIDRHYAEWSVELLSVKPGLSGLWQICGRSAIRFPQRRAMDLQLVRSLTPRTYLNILVRTVPALITGKGAW